MNEPIDMKGISRIDSLDTHGWYVRIYKNGKTYSKLYSDNKYGGSDRALLVAFKARLLALESLKDIQTQPKRRLVTSDKRNKSGIIGVSKTTKINKNGTTSDYYQVTWSPEAGHVKNRQWSVRKFGEQYARKLAIEFRHSVMKEIYGDRFPEGYEEGE
jgi:hypothetical protein